LRVFGLLFTWFLTEHLRPISKVLSNLMQLKELLLKYSPVPSLISFHHALRHITIWELLASDFFMENS
jgi:hypothetical protein